MKMTKVLGVLVVLAVANLSFASLSQFQLTVNGAAPVVEGTPASPEVKLAVGGTATVSVWIKTDYAVTGVTALLGWDRSTTSGTAAVKLDNLLSGSLASSVDGDLTTLPQNALAGGRATSGARSYGTYFGGNLASGTNKTYSTWTKLGDVTITNLGLLTETDIYHVALWDNPGTSLSYETRTVATPTALSIMNDVVVTGVPEPISIVMLALGGLGLLRRKSC